MEDKGGGSLLNGHTVGKVGCGELSPEQQHLSPGPDSQVHQSILGEVLTPTQRLPKILKCGRELGACDPLARGKKEKWKSRGGHLQDLRRKIWKENCSEGRTEWKNSER